MRADTKLLRLVQPDNGGPHIKRVLENMAEHYGAPRSLVDDLIAEGRLAKYGDRKGATWGLPRPPRAAAAGRRRRQRGFALPMPIFYLLAATAALGALWGLYAAIDGRAFARGQAARQLEWDRANARAQAELRAREQDVSDAIKEGEARRQAAASRASEATDRWKEAVRENRRQGIQLATCGAGEPPAPAAPADRTAAGGTEAPADGPQGAGGDRRRGVRFTLGFVRLYDGAWTDAAGEPVFASPGGPAAAPAAGAVAPGSAGGSGAEPSPYGPDDLLEVHGDNAARASACRRDYAALIERIRAAEKAWSAPRPK